MVNKLYPYINMGEQSSHIHFRKSSESRDFFSVIHLGVEQRERVSQVNQSQPKTNSMAISAPLNSRHLFGPAFKPKKEAIIPLEQKSLALRQSSLEALRRSEIGKPTPEKAPPSRRDVATSGCAGESNWASTAARQKEGSCVQKSFFTRVFFSDSLSQLIRHDRRAQCQILTSGDPSLWIPGIQYSW